MVSKAAVPCGPRDGPERVAFWVILPVRVVDASGAAKRAQASLLWALNAPATHGHLVRAAGTGGSTWRGVRTSGWAVGLTTAAARDRCPV